MTAVARVLPRDWDGRRLLRFLAGLAMLALAFAVPATPSPAAAESLPPAVAVVPQSDIAVAVVTRSDIAGSEVTRSDIAGFEIAPPSVAAAPVLDLPPAPVVPAAPLLIAAAAVVLTGLASRSHAVRGPPLT